MNADHVRDLATAIYAARARTAGGCPLPQADDQFLEQFANRQGIDRVVDCLAADVVVFEAWGFHGSQLVGNLLGRKAPAQQVGDQFEQFVAGHQLLLGPAGQLTLAHGSLGMLGGVRTPGIAIAANLATDRGGAAVEYSGNGALAHTAQQTDLDVGAFFAAEFLIRHGNTVRKVQALHSVFTAAIQMAIRGLARNAKK